MSLNAMVWVLHLPHPDKSKKGNQGRLAVKGGQRDVLALLADRAGPDGKAAWPTQQDLARTLCVTERTIRRYLLELEDAGLIRRGDQRLVEHIRPDRRPIVWDLAMSTTREAVDNPTERGDANVPPSAPRGDRNPPNGGTGAVRNGGTTAVLENRPSYRPEPPKQEKTAPAVAAVEIPDDWGPNEGHARQAERRGVDVDDVALAFVAHARANGRRLVDWDAGFTYWLTKASPHHTSTARPGAPPGRSTTADRVAQALEVGERVAQAMERQGGQQLAIGAR